MNWHGNTRAINYYHFFDVNKKVGIIYHDFIRKCHQVGLESLLIGQKKSFILFFCGIFLLHSEQ